MTKKSWTFADPEWWAYAATQCIPCPLEHRSALPTDALGRLDLDSAGRHEEDLIQYLNGCQALSKTQARLLVFWARALKKWQFMPPARVKQLTREALDGFEGRNSNANRESCLKSRPYLAVHMREFLRRALPPVEGGRVAGRFGPGAVAERLSHPRRYALLGLWHILGCHPNLVHLINATGCGYADDFRRALAMQSNDIARLCAVDKSYSKRRLITVEPTWHTFEQQRVRSLLLESLHRGALKGTAMDQEYVDGAKRQQRLALQASRTGKLATLDLRDASDNIALSDVFEVFPAWVCYELESARTTMYQREDHPPRPLYMYGGMGNATTFIVETLFFAAFVYAVARLEGLPPFVSVFGDDIICHSWTAEALMDRWQDMPCFQVNKLKSFWGHDPMRESCGVYAYKGSDVSAPHITGYANNVDGRYGVCDLHARLEPDNLFWGLGHAIAQEGILENYSFLIDGYPSISDWTVPTNDDSVVSRLERCTQTRQVKVRVYEPRQRAVRVDIADPVSVGCEIGSAMGLIRTTRAKQMAVLFAEKDAGYRARPRWRCTYRAW